jgi:hypothetical protein
MASTTLPTSRAFVTSLIENLTTHSAQNVNPTLKNMPPALRSTLLTLHILFPNELLPALDVLDRNLVTCLHLKNSSHPYESETYFVRSAQQPSNHHYHHRDKRDHGNGRYSTNPVSTTTHYEVRLKAWNCSCPAFAFSAFPATNDSTLNNAGDDTDPVVAEDKRAWKFGGMLLDGAAGELAVCKHLLACVLLKQCPALFAGGVEAREVEREEYAGWCAGWGS